MKTGIDIENWKKKYFDSLSSLENEQKRFRAMEATLKRLAGRLCTASLGQSSRLDEEIKRLQTAMRRETSLDELEGFTPALTAAIQALDHSADARPLVAGTPQVAVAAPVAPARPIAAVARVMPAPPVATAAAVISAAAVSSAPLASVPVSPVAPPAVSEARVVAQPATVQLEPSSEVFIGEERVRAILAAMLDELRRDTELLTQVDALDSKLTAAMTRDEFPDVLSALTALVGQRIKRIERAKQEIEVLLSHMVGKLDEIGQFVADQNQSQSQSHASSETLNVQLVGEMKAMGESVESADDLQQIRTQVRSRIDSIDRHLQAFRQREAALASAMQARSDQLRSRITELEAEATRLHSQLKDEQRQSTIDVLTKIPNRLAYDKRIDEELRRWQRFKQPTCVAVWDVDHFKRVNDTYGHRAGDRVLSAVAECLAGRIRGTDFLARYGGEEFVMILPGTRLEDAVRVVDEMRTAIARIGFHFRGTPVSITVSSGVTALMSNDSAGAAFDRADKALYQAKADGRNRCVSG